MTHNGGLIIDITLDFCRTSIEQTPENYLKSLKPLLNPLTANVQYSEHTDSYYHLQLTTKDKTKSQIGEESITCSSHHITNTVAKTKTCHFAYIHLHLHIILWFL